MGCKSKEIRVMGSFWIWSVIIVILLPSFTYCIESASVKNQTSNPTADSNLVGKIETNDVNNKTEENVRIPRESGRLWPAADSSSSNPNPKGVNKVPKPEAKEQQTTEKRESRNGFTFGEFGQQQQQFPIVTPTNPAVYPPTIPNNNCICVPYYYCDEGQVVSDGSGVIDIRQGWPCKSILEVCCRNPRIPSTTTQNPIRPTTIPIVTSTAFPGYNARCGQLNPNGVNARILGFKDSETQFGEYPWMSAVLEKKTVQGRYVNYFLCGASLVWPSVVVTAAHCVKGKRAEYLTIRLGEWDTQSTNEFYPYQDIQAREIVIHPAYYPGALYSDIALIFLQRPAVLAPHIDTICLPSIFPQYDNSSCWVTGWGKNSWGFNGSYQAILKEVELPIVPRPNCQEALRRTNLGPTFNLHDSFLCAGGLKGQDACVGDGGGPLVCASLIDPWRYVLAGVVSWGVHCGNYGVPGVYVDASRFRQWIDTTISSRVPNYDVSRVTINQRG